MSYITFIDALHINIYRPAKIYTYVPIYVR